MDFGAAPVDGLEAVDNELVLEFDHHVGGEGGPELKVIMTLHAEARLLRMTMDEFVTSHPCPDPIS